MGSELLTGDLFQQALIEPVASGARELFVVSGYASPAMVTHHLEQVKKEFRKPISIDLVVGMAGRDGLTRDAILGFQSIPRQASGSNFSCAFSLPERSVHSKVFVWNDDSGPMKAFVGSANYTQFGFGLLNKSQTHLEVLTEVDPNQAFDYVLECGKKTVDYRSSDLYKYIPLVESNHSASAQDFEEVLEVSADEASVILPLVQTTKDPGQIHQKSGLNWGQREGRNPNQAYIPIPTEVSSSGFFPDRGVHFQIVTDDGQSFIGTVAQDGGKAIETPSDNCILGRYFRIKLGLSEGVFVDTEDLTRFGSNAVRFSKIDDETYKLTFEPGTNISLSK